MSAHGTSVSEPRADGLDEVAVLSQVDARRAVGVADDELRHVRGQATLHRRELEGGQARVGQCRFERAGDRPASRMGVGRRRPSSWAACLGGFRVRWASVGPLARFAGGAQDCDVYGLDVRRRAAWGAS
jgi:hypothetical protein